MHMKILLVPTSAYLEIKSSYSFQKFNIFLLLRTHQCIDGYSALKTCPQILCSSSHQEQDLCPFPSRLVYLKDLFMTNRLRWDF